MFFKLLVDSGVEPSQQNASKCDLIYRTVCRGNKKMEFKDFLDALVKVAELLFHKVVDDSSIALKALLEHHLMGLYLKLAVKTETIVESMQLEFNELVHVILKDVSPTLLYIY